MRVTKVTPFGKRKSKVFLAEGFAFVLYKEELCQWGIAEEEELGDEVFKRICREVLFPRAKEKALSLLEVQARTCCQIKERLLREGYPPAVTEQVAAFLTEYRLTDDLAFAAAYAKGLSEQIKKPQWDTYEIKNSDADLGKYLAQQYQSLSDEMEQAGISDQMSQVLKDSFEPFIDKFLDALDTKIDHNRERVANKPWQAGLIRTEYINRNEVYRAFAMFQ